MAFESFNFPLFRGTCVLTCIYRPGVGTLYKTGEHCWQAAKYLETAPELAAKITMVETIDEAHTISHTEGMDKHRPDWDEVKYGGCNTIRSIYLAGYCVSQQPDHF